MSKNKFTFLVVVSVWLLVMACGKGGSSTETKSTETNTTTSSSPAANNTSTETTPTITDSDVAGTYSVDGKGVDGSSYKGDLEVKKRDAVYQFSWKVGLENYDGVGVQNGDKVAVAYTTGTDGKGCGAVIYKIGAGDTLEGKWGEWGVNQSGSEKAKPIGALSGGTGKFEVEGANPDGSAYEGKLIITKGANDVFQFAWDTAGSKYIGTGVKMGEFLAAGSGAKQCGFVIYEVKNGNLEGKWGVPGSTALGSEKATKK